MMTDNNLTPYPTMKPSGVPWLGDVPAHWQVLRGKHLFQCIDVRSTGGSEELLTVSSNYGVIPRKSATVTMFKAESYVGYKLCWPNDLVINSLWAWSQGLGVSKYHGIVSSAYGVYRCRQEANLDPWYVNQLVRSTPFQWELQIRSKGIWTSRLQLTDESFLDAPFVVPPLSEQRAIVRYLDYVDRRIRRYIRAKQKLIKLLEEQKQAIIHRAVTRGLDPDVRPKPSGVEWLVQIPTNYKRTKLGRVCTSIRDGTHNPPPAVPGEHRLLSVRNIIGGKFVTRDDDRTMTPDAFAELQKSYTVRSGDVVIALVGATTGKSAVVSPMEKVTVQRSIGILRPNKSIIDSHFLQLVISSRVVQDQIRRIMDKYAAQPGIYLAELGGLQVIFPPLSQQMEIVAFVHGETKAVNQAIDRATREITLLREYRTRLIADVVTGKLDVRGAAARLPAAEEEPGAADAVDVEEADDPETDAADAEEPAGAEGE